jgi:hypothetical protein
MTTTPNTIDTPAVDDAPLSLSDAARAMLDEIGPAADAQAETEVAPVVDETSTSDDAPETEAVETETPAGEAEETAWHDDPEVQALAASMGLDAAKLAKLPSRDAFDAALLMLDTDLAAQGRAFWESQQQPQTPPADQANNGQAVPPATPAASAPAPAPATVSQELQPLLDTIGKLSPDEYPPEVIGAFQGLAHYTQSQAQELAAMREEQAKLMQFATWQAQQYQQQQIAQEEAFFHDVLGQIDRDLYGKDAETATPEQRANRAKVAPEVGALRTAESQRRQQYVQLDKALVTRAHRVAFGDVLVTRAVKQANDQKNQQLAAQSRKRLGGATRQAKPAVPPPVSGDLTEDPVLLDRARQIMSRPAHDDRDVVG